MDGDQAGLVHPREFFLTEPGALRVRAPPPPPGKVRRKQDRLFESVEQAIEKVVAQRLTPSSRVASPNW